MERWRDRSERQDLFTWYDGTRCSEKISCAYRAGLHRVDDDDDGSSVMIRKKGLQLGPAMVPKRSRKRPAPQCRPVSGAAATKTGVLRILRTSNVPWAAFSISTSISFRNSSLCRQRGEVLPSKEQAFVAFLGRSQERLFTQAFRRRI
jgi:hypothetical protein